LNLEEFFVAGLRRICKVHGGLIAKSGGKTVHYDGDGKIKKTSRAKSCYGCGRDGEGGSATKLCPGCQAYREHQQ
jgi:hypothetical protein